MAPFPAAFAGIAARTVVRSNRSVLARARIEGISESRAQRRKASGRTRSRSANWGVVRRGSNEFRELFMSQRGADRGFRARIAFQAFRRARIDPNNPRELSAAPLAGVCKVTGASDAPGRRWPTCSLPDCAEVLSHIASKRCELLSSIPLIISGPFEDSLVIRGPLPVRIVLPGGFVHLARLHLAGL